MVHSECVVGHKHIDNDHEDYLFNYLKRFNVLSSEEYTVQKYTPKYSKILDEVNLCQKVV